MPKVVDHELRRRELAEAFWAVTVRDGVGSASVRAVAAEAGCSPAALRYYFSAQEDLLDFTWTLAHERALARVEALRVSDSPFEAALQRLEQALPLDDERMAEAQLWFSVAALAPAHPRFGQRVGERHETLGQGCADIVAGLRTAGVCPSERDTSAEGIRLHALLDGLAFHSVVHPGVYDVERLRAVLRHHLHDLCSWPRA